MSPSPAAFPTVSEVERIASLPDPVLRNLLITQCYSELSLAPTQRTGLSANWCTFAAWASKQAGQTIRKEDLTRALEAALTSDKAIHQTVEEVIALAKQVGAQLERRKILAVVLDLLDPAAAVERSSQAVGRGNQKVFEEIGREFARFYAACLEDSQPDPDKIEAFCAGLRPGDPPEGQRYLRQAFNRYYQAFFESDLQKRAELMLLANIEIGFHEQTRLQPEIAAALDAAVLDPESLANRLISGLFGGRAWIVQLILYFVRAIRGQSRLDAAIQALVSAARQRIRLLFTEHLMVIGLPHGLRLHLGQDLQAEFPATLRQLSNPDLLAALQQIDPTPDSLRETGAVDWADLPERLHFILDMFRCYQENADLFLPPFSTQQAAEIKAGRIPSGAL